MCMSLYMSRIYKRDEFTKPAYQSFISLSPLSGDDRHFVMDFCVALFLMVLATIANAQTDYCKISLQNTMCLYQPYKLASTCPKVINTTVTAADRDLIVKIHNELRSKVARGLETRGTPGPQPKASNMRAFTWDNELALMADTHVRQCVYKHDTNRDVPRFKVGQNIAFSSTYPSNGVLNWNATINSWYNEVAVYNKSLVTKFTSTNNANNQAIGHYTQVVWANTSKVGCSVINWVETSGWYRYFYACNYGAAGNFLNQPVYSIGNPVSACPAGTVASATTGLCN